MRPVVAVVTNADPEHLDYYGTRERLLEAFAAFANSVPFSGAAILGIDHPGCRRDRAADRGATDPFRLAPGRPRPRRIDRGPGGGQRCQVRLASGDRFAFELALPGRHNILNALAALAVGLELDLPAKQLAEALPSFPGVRRRFERKGSAAGVEVVDDYAHHPAEVRAALAAARSIHPGKLTAIFQPHRFTRTRDCWSDFVTAFGDADRVVISDIYPASEAPIPGIDSEKLCREIADRGHRAAVYGGPLGQIAKRLARALRVGGARHDPRRRRHRGPRPPAPARALFTAGVSVGGGNMIGSAAREALERCLGDRVEFDVPLSRHTSLRIGGPADALVTPADRAELARTLAVCAEHDLPTTVLGGGFNVLVLEGGVRGVVLRLRKLRRIERVASDLISVEAGASHATITRYCVDHGLSGLEFGAGIPGTLGGWIAMNAGIGVRELKDVVRELDVLDRKGRAMDAIPRSALDFRYRELASLAPGSVIVGARLEVVPSERVRVEAEVARLLEQRHATQPIDQPSCGSVFRNPPGDYAGRLIEAAGLKGTRAGAAEISPVHANFIVNHGDAKASDVLCLIERARSEVAARTGTLLETEVKILGTPAEKAA